MSSRIKLYGQNLKKVSRSETSTKKELVKSLYLGDGNYVIIPSLVHENKTNKFLLHISFSHKQIKSW